MDSHRNRRAGGDLLGGAKRPLLWRGPYGYDGPGSEIPPDAPCLLQTVGGEVENREGSTDQVIRVVYFGMMYEINQCGHWRTVWRLWPLTPGNRS